MAQILEIGIKNESSKADRRQQPLKSTGDSKWKFWKHSNYLITTSFVFNLNIFLKFRVLVMLKIIVFISHLMLL